MVLVSAQREVIDANPGALRLFGGTIDELRAAGAPGVIHPDDRESDEDLFAELVSGSRVRIGRRSVTSDGSGACSGAG
jgi:PAS domain S-box-containing protein